MKRTTATSITIMTRWVLLLQLWGVLLSTNNMTHAFQLPQSNVQKSYSPTSRTSSSSPHKKIVPFHPSSPRSFPPMVRLFQSARRSNNNNNNNSPKQKQNKNPHPLLKLVRQCMTLPTKFVTKFQTLSVKAKGLVVAQLLVMSLLLGSGIHRGMKTQALRKQNAPVEFPYSTFLDLCESNNNLNGKSSSSSTSKNNQNTNLHIGNVVIGPDKIGYRIMRLDTDEQRQALEEIQQHGGTTTTTTTPVEIPQRLAYTRKVQASPELVQYLRNHDIPFQAAYNPRSNVAALTVRSIILTFYLLIMVRMYRTMNGGGSNGNGAVGKLAQPSGDLPMAKFDEIEGIDKAKFEVMELVDTIRNPDKYAILGARAPTGLLLEGPPGTGKTMLARATAATAGVPLLYCSGSDFVEMFVGRGAARVRKTFARAEKLAPCIIFIDELDALGKSRAMDGMLGGGGRGGNDEAEQTLNQLLACMDGLEPSKGVCVLAATNRRDVLDQALVRPGRFDRIIKVELPDLAGRERILRVHAQKLPGFLEQTGVDPQRPGSLGTGRAVDLSAVASVTQGLSGAELEFIVNEAAIRAVRRVSRSLREGGAAQNVTPVVSAIDFEGSIQNYYETRKPSNKNVGTSILNTLVGNNGPSN